MLGWVIWLATIVFQANTVGWYNVPVRIGNDTDVVHVHVWPSTGTVQNIQQWGNVASPDNVAAMSRPSGSRATMMSWGRNPYMLTYNEGDRVIGVEGNSATTGFHPGLQPVLQHFGLDLKSLLGHQLVLDSSRTDPKGQRHDYYSAAFEQNGYFVELHKIQVTGITPVTQQTWTITVKSHEGHAVLMQGQQATTAEAQQSTD